MTPVLVLTGVTDPVVLGTCLERGAIGIASKADPFDRLGDVAVILGSPPEDLP